MTPSTHCYDLIKSFEGLRLEAYPDPATGGEPWTIGYGTTRTPTQKVVKGMVCTKEQAEAWLKHDVDAFAAGVAKLTGAIKQPHFDALVSLAYNIGLGNFGKSTLLRMVKGNEDNPAIRAQFMRWNKAAGKVMKGLTKRREAEANLYFS